MFDIVLADGGGGYYYYNPLGTVLPLLGFFILSLLWNWGVIRLLNRGKGWTLFDNLWGMFLYTGSVFILEILLFMFIYNPFITSAISIIVIMIIYCISIDFNFKNAFLMSILTNPIWIYLLCEVV